MALTLAHAATETGPHRSSILRAINRVFPPAARAAERAAETRQRAHPETAANTQTHQLAQVEQRLSELKAVLEDMRAERDRWQAEVAAWRLTDQRERHPVSWWQWVG
jgi:hypothetical protein